VLASIAVSKSGRSSEGQLWVTEEGSSAGKYDSSTSSKYDSSKLQGSMSNQLLAAADISDGLS
jgi:hypothetical protein